MAVTSKRPKSRKQTGPLRAKRRQARKSHATSEPIKSDPKLDLAFRYLREGRTQKFAAETTGISVGRFRRYVRRNKLAKFEAGRWKITDRRIREIAVISDGGSQVIKVRGFGPASLAMRHRAAVQQFLDTNDASLLEPFEGQEVTNIAKQKYSLETRPNVLLRMANAGSDADMKIYRLVD